MLLIMRVRVVETKGTKLGVRHSCWEQHEARQVLNIVTGIEPGELGFKYEIEIASGQLVEIDKVIKGCKLEIKGHVFDIYLIPFGHGSFDVIIGMDWLSNHKAKIFCHEKVVRIPLVDGKPKRVRAMNMTIQSSIKDMILSAQKEAIDESKSLQKGLDEMIEQRSDVTLYYID
uniref:Putative reverse transcriptase domain-containing protein n=1 Tax=Tanacetum cinerariifolium TaxID=118510 RepID=A0A699KWN4_TANCI|nr:putative reverse transcriptase domain-containing protein [Tanacetum cinerariifolium]